MRVHQAELLYGPQVAPARTHVLAPVEDHGFEPQLEHLEGRKVTGGAGTHDDHFLAARHVAEALAQHRFGRKRLVERHLVAQYVHRHALARIDRALHQPQVPYLFVGQPELLCHAAPVLGGVVYESGSYPDIYLSCHVSLFRLSPK